jgi:hypothetical protein
VRAVARHEQALELAALVLVVGCQQELHTNVLVVAPGPVSAKRRAEPSRATLRYIERIKPSKALSTHLGANLVPASARSSHTHPHCSTETVV